MPTDFPGGYEAIGAVICPESAGRSSEGFALAR